MMSKLLTVMGYGIAFMMGVLFLTALVSGTVLLVSLTLGSVCK